MVFIKLGVSDHGRGYEDAYSHIVAYRAGTLPEDQSATQVVELDVTRAA